MFSVGVHEFIPPFRRLEQGAHSLAVEAVLAGQGQQRFRRFAVEGAAFDGLCAVDEAEVLFRQETAGPVVRTGTMGGGYFDQFAGQRHDAFQGFVPHQFTGPEGAEIPCPQNSPGQQFGVRAVQGGAALAAACAAASAFRLFMSLGVYQIGHCHLISASTRRRRMRTRRNSLCVSSMFFCWCSS